MWPLIFAALSPVGSAVILLIVAAGAPHRAPPEQATGGVYSPIRPVYLLVVNSDYSNEPLSGPQLSMFETRIVGKLGGERARCKKDFHSQAEVQKIIESDGQQEALYLDTTQLKGSRPKVALWAESRDHREGKIREIKCEYTEVERCKELAMRDFPADVARHDEDCHRVIHCKVDQETMFIVPLP